MARRRPPPPRRHAARASPHRPPPRRRSGLHQRVPADSPTSPSYSPSAAAQSRWQLQPHFAEVTRRPARARPPAAPLDAPGSPPPQLLALGAEPELQPHIAVVLARRASPPVQPLEPRVLAGARGRGEERESARSRVRSSRPASLESESHGARARRARAHSQRTAFARIDRRGGSRTLDDTWCLRSARRVRARSLERASASRRGAAREGRASARRQPVNRHRWRGGGPFVAPGAHDGGDAR